MTNVFDVCDYGAVGDGVTDSTAAFQKAIDLAGEVHGAVMVPPGMYLCSTLYMKADISMCGFSGWGYRETGGSVIKLSDEKAHCLIDMSGAFGARLRDLQLLGNHAMGENIHGVYIRWEDQVSRLNDDPVREDNALPEDCQIGFREDSVTIESCHIKNFSGNAIHLEKIWGFTVRNCMLIANGGSAIYINGWDGWICDCIMHTNHGAGVYADNRCAAVTMTGNRIEWNRNGGINLVNASLLNITGNYFDRAYGPAVTLIGKAEPCYNITATGNIFYRSGKYMPSFENNKYENCHIYLDCGNNLTISGNTFLHGKDDFGEGGYSPDYCVVMKDIESSVISNNTMKGGALVASFADLGGNERDNSTINNVGLI